MRNRRLRRALCGYALWAAPEEHRHAHSPSLNLDKVAQPWSFLPI
ncbi:hypothetical protein [Scytonema sp. PCC 10023]